MALQCILNILVLLFVVNMPRCMHNVAYCDDDPITPQPPWPHLITDDGLA